MNAMCAELPAQLQKLIPSVEHANGRLTRFMLRKRDPQHGDVWSREDLLHLIRTGLWLAYERLRVPGQAFDWEQAGAELVNQARRYVLQETLRAGTVAYDARQRWRTRKYPGTLAWDAWDQDSDVLSDPQEKHPAVETLRQALTPAEFECLWQQWALGRRQREIAADIIRTDPVRYAGPLGFKRALNLVGKRSERAMRKARQVLRP